MVDRGKARPPVRPKSQPESSRRREELLAAAAETFADMGYSQARIRDIAARAGILNGSLYYHFDTKESMVEELLARFFDELARRYAEIDSSAGDVETALMSLFRETLVLASEQLRTVQILQKDWHYFTKEFPFVRDGLKIAEEKWVEVLLRGVQDGHFNPDFDAVLVYRSIRSSIFDAAVWEGRQHKYEFERLVELQSKLFLSGLRVR